MREGGKRYEDSEREKDRERGKGGTDAVPQKMLDRGRYSARD